MTAVSSELIRGSLDASFDERLRGTYRVEYSVVSDSEADSPLSILADAQGLGGGNDAVPAFGDAYSFDSGATQDLGSFARPAHVFKPDGEKLPKEWRIVVMYEPPRRHTAGGFVSTQTVLQTADPLNWPVLFKLEKVEEEEELTRAKNLFPLDHIGRPMLTEGPIVNTAGNQLTTPVLITKFRVIIAAQKNFPSEGDIWLLNAIFHNTMNKVDIAIPTQLFATSQTFAKHTLKFIGADAMEPQQRAESASLYYPAKIRLEYKKEGWDLWVPNEGFKQLVYDEQGQLFDRPQPCLMEETQEVVVEGQTVTQLTGIKIPVSEPVYLDEFGRQRHPSQPPTEVQYRYLDPVEYRGTGTTGLGIGLT